MLNRPDLMTQRRIIPHLLHQEAVGRHLHAAGHRRQQVAPARRLLQPRQQSGRRQLDSHLYHILRGQDGPRRHHQLQHGYGRRVEVPHSPGRQGPSAGPLRLAPLIPGGSRGLISSNFSCRSTCRSRPSRRGPSFARARSSARPARRGSPRGCQTSPQPPPAPDASPLSLNILRSRPAGPHPLALCRPGFIPLYSTSIYLVDQSRELLSPSGADH